MVFGYSTNAFTQFSLLESIEMIARLGFGGVEIMCDKPHLYPPAYDDAALETVKAALDKHNLKVTNLNGFTLFAVGDTYLPSWIESDPKRRDIRVQHTLDCLNVAKALGCKYISIPPGGPLEKNMTMADALMLFHDGLDRVIPLAESLGVQLLIEPEPGLLIEDSTWFVHFIRNVGSSMVGLNFDVGHFYCVDEDPAETFYLIFEWIKHVHIEDIGADRVHEHLIPGRGAIDFLALFKMMKRMGYEGDICLELYPYIDMPEKAGEESLAFFAPLFDEAGLDILK